MHIHTCTNNEVSPMPGLHDIDVKDPSIEKLGCEALPYPAAVSALTVTLYSMHITKSFITTLVFGVTSVLCTVTVPTPTTFTS